MFERFTDRARRVVVLAQEEARTLNHNYIGTEHLLLGLIHEGEGVAAQALEALDISLSAVRELVEEIVGQGQVFPSGHIPFTPRAKKVLDLALREALQLGHNYIGTEHILLGLIREGEGVAAQVLQTLGADLNRVRQQVLLLLGADTPESAALRQRPERRRTMAGGIELSPRTVFVRRAEGEPERGPVCPRCDADLTRSVRYRVHDVPLGEAESEESDSRRPSRKAAFLYCADCGRLVAANLLEPDAGDEPAMEPSAAQGAPRPGEEEPEANQA